MNATWVLLIYTVPAEPSRKRAFVWREVKKLGAIYLRDGVCILPERPETIAATRALADRIVELEGQATLVGAATLTSVDADSVVGRFRAARAEEYAEIVGAAEQLLQHIARETAHREFSFSEVEELDQDLGKLKRWHDQVRARDYFPDLTNASADGLLERCDEALAEFTVQAAEQDAAS